MNNNLFRAFSERSFLYLWIGEIFTQIASNFFNFFLVFLVFSLTHSNTKVSLVVTTFTVPAIFLGIIAGAYVDRWNKKHVLLYTNVLRAALLFFLALFHRNEYAIYITSFFIAIATQFFIPAETPIIPLLVPESLLLSANALFGLGLFGSIFVAYVLSGPVILLFGPQNTLLFLSVLTLLGSLFIAFIHMPKHRTPVSVKPFVLMKEVNHALTILRSSRAISSSLFLLALSQILVLIFAVIAPGYATQILHINIRNFPLYFVTPAAVGVVVGAIIIVNFFQNIDKRTLIKVGLFLSGFAMLFLPYSSFLTSREFVLDLNNILPGLLDITRLHILVVLAFLLGLANALVFVPSNTILQQQTSDEIRGRIYGVLNSLVGLLSFLPVLLVGGLSDTFGIDKVITGIGVVLLCIGIVRTYRDATVYI